MFKADAQKAYVYATWNNLLLVFDEPDFPHIPFQVPGGTLNKGELPLQGAKREFEEETGLTCPASIIYLDTVELEFMRDNCLLRYIRHYYHAVLDGPYPESWLHWETDPFGGGPPIQFRFSWMPLVQASTALEPDFGDVIKRHALQRRAFN